MKNVTIEIISHYKSIPTHMKSFTTAISKQPHYQVFIQTKFIPVFCEINNVYAPNNHCLDHQQEK